MKKCLNVAALWLALMILGSSLAHADFLGKPPLSAHPGFRHEFAPYDLAKINCLALNYCENLCDMRLDPLAFTHEGYDKNNGDDYNLQYPEADGRFLEGLAFEARYSPVVRLELARRLLEGLMSAHIPGTKAEYFLRHKSGGKTYLILDDAQDHKQGRLTLSNLGDSMEGQLKIGFRARMKNQWQGTEAFQYTDRPPLAANAGVMRDGYSGQKLPPSTPGNYWNESPYRFTRLYRNAMGAVDFHGSYGFSDEDLPVEYAFASPAAEQLEIVLGEPGKPMPLFLNGQDAPGFIELPDRKTIYRSDRQGDIVIPAPAEHYFILRKPTNFFAPNCYSSALLVMWEGPAATIQALAKYGYGEIHLNFGKKHGAAGGKVWLYPFPWLNEDDTGYVYRNAENFLKNGRMMQNGFCSCEGNNAVASGMAAGAWLMTHYNDPCAPTVRQQAEDAVDGLLLPENKGKWILRTFFEVRAAAWMVMVGQEMHDRAMIEKYQAWVQRLMTRMLSAKNTYDGSGWASGWDHFCCIKAVWLAWEATGRKDYLEAYNRALGVYTIDAKGIYRYGKAMKAPGGFETYSGSMPLGVWGHAGALDKVNLLLNLDAPNGWDPDPNVPVRLTWHDGGAGPWCQDDAQPEFAGFCLRGLNLPRDKQYLTPMGSGVMYDARGKVTLPGGHIIDNPFFLDGHDPLRTLAKGEKLPDPQTVTVDCRPGEQTEKEHLVSAPWFGIPAGFSRANREIGVPRHWWSSRLSNGRRELKAGAAPLVYAFELAPKSKGAAVDLNLAGDAYQVDVSPDGEHWYRRFDSWSAGLERRSLDLSFLAGCPDEMIPLMTIAPPTDKAVLKEKSESPNVRMSECPNVRKSESSDVRKSESPKVCVRPCPSVFVCVSPKVREPESFIAREHCRYVNEGGSFVYRLSLPRVCEAHAELIVGNGYRVEISPDGEKWRMGLNADQFRDAKQVADGAWIRMIDLTPALNPQGIIYVRFSDLGRRQDFNDRDAFLRRMTVYGIFKTGKAYVRLANVGRPQRPALQLERLAFRSW